MGSSPEPSLSRDALLAIVIGVAGIAGIVLELNWIVRSLFVVIAIGLIIYGALRHSAHPLIRGSVALIAIALFIGFSWQPIWKDFRNPSPAGAPTVSSYYWDTLSESEATDLYSQLKDIPKSEITFFCGSAHCLDLTTQLVNIFKSSGWTANQSQGGSPEQKGIYAQYRDIQVLRALQIALTHATNNRIRIEIRQAESAMPIWFIVGMKP